MDLLNDSDVLRIGVWGMGGVGKTTLVKNLNNKLKGSSSTSTQHFGVVIWATVSKKLDLRKVLIQIAERLNLEVGTGESVPQPEVHTGCKIILTSHSLEVCREMTTDEEVKVDVLRDEES
ncbi:hypothetical protein LWI28_026429 [Acer negundo]|uniref:NB-ARC domain-containing protein n=1 Tax=Acer negundo TaxID=4023 RepID=A0AAD5NYI4_ACENE|nr:hypothetical protein LWI28_026429 [Acer negundo]